MLFYKLAFLGLSPIAPRVFSPVGQRRLAMNARLLCVALLPVACGAESARPDVCAALQHRLSLTAAELQELVIAWPSLHTYSYLESVDPTLSSLQEELSLDESELKAIVLRRPELLGYDAQDLAPFLHIPGMSPKEVRFDF